MFANLQGHILPTIPSTLHFLRRPRVLCRLTSYAYRRPDAFLVRFALMQVLGHQCCQGRCGHREGPLTEAILAARHLHWWLRGWEPGEANVQWLQSWCWVSEACPKYEPHRHCYSSLCCLSFIVILMGLFLCKFCWFIFCHTCTNQPQH